MCPTRRHADIDQQDFLNFFQRLTRVSNDICWQFFRLLVDGVENFGRVKGKNAGTGETRDRIFLQTLRGFAADDSEMTGK